MHVLLHLLSFASCFQATPLLTVAVSILTGPHVTGKATAETESFLQIGASPDMMFLKVLVSRV